MPGMVANGNAATAFHQAFAYLEIPFLHLRRVDRALERVEGDRWIGADGMRDGRSQISAKVSDVYPEWLGDDKVDSYHLICTLWGRKNL